MMSNELVALRGHLALSVETAAAKEAEIDVDIDALRGLADKYEYKTELRTDYMLAIVARMDKSVKTLRELRERIASIKKDLGET